MQLAVQWTIHVYNNDIRYTLKVIYMYHSIQHQGLSFRFANTSAVLIKRLSSVYFISNIVYFRVTCIANTERIHIPCAYTVHITCFWKIGKAHYTWKCNGYLFRNTGQLYTMTTVFNTHVIPRAKSHLIMSSSAAWNTPNSCSLPALLNQCTATDAHSTDTCCVLYMP